MTAHKAKPTFRVIVIDEFITHTETGTKREWLHFDCGHNHRTVASARACQGDSHKRLPAAWHGSKVLPTNRQGVPFMTGLSAMAKGVDRG